jgi:hypothetical protein
MIEIPIPLLCIMFLAFGACLGSFIGYTIGRDSASDDIKRWMKNDR